MQTIEQLGLNAAAIVPLVVAIVQLVKMAGERATKYAPFIALGAGILITWLFEGATLAMPAGHVILDGIIYGLSASGLYSSTKHTAHTIKADQNKEDTGGL